MRRHLLLLFSIIVFGQSFVSSAFAVDPTPSTTPPFPPYPTPTETREKCSDVGKNGVVYPPNGECFDPVELVETQIDEYPLTCVEPPQVDYKETYVGETAPTTVDVIIGHDLSQAHLGGFGPSLSVLSSSTNLDNIAKSYLFSGLFDKPYYIKKNTPREAYRTYWRYFTAVEQANFKANYINKVDKNLENLFWSYIDESGKEQKTNVKELKGDLPGCLLSSPVCPTFYEEYLKLSDKTRNKYDTLLPFAFGSSRGFLVLNGQISREKITYIDAIIQGTVSQEGLFSAYTPSSFIKSPEKFFITSNESVLDQAVIAKGKITSCPTPKKSKSVPAPKTYPDSDVLLQTVKINLTAKKIDTTPASCGCNSPSCTLVPCASLNQIACGIAGCTWSEEVSTFELSGKGEGSPIGVLNNPKVNTITDSVVGNDSKKIPSFFKMMVPDFVKVPEKIIISASGISAKSVNPNAAVSGANTIYRENNLAQDAMHYLQNCWLVPGDLQKSSKCPRKKTNSCSTGLGEVPPLDVTDSACTVKNNTLNLPQPLIDAIQKAGEVLEVPPSLIIGLFYGEGAFNPGSRFLDAGFVEENLKACAVLPECDPNTSYIKNIVDMEDYNWKYGEEAILKLDPERIPNACNLLDSIFAWAAVIKSNRNGSPAFAGKTCFGIPLNAGVSGSTSCSWNDTTVESAIRVWEFGTAYNSTYGCATKENSCATGGGGAANCATGGDTCETISNRYSAPSHNACVYDIYKSNK